MEYRLLGRTGVRVSAFSLGSMMFGSDGNGDPDDCIRIIHRALEAVVNLLDTADVYSQGQAEEIIGRAMRHRREDIVLATKLWAPMGPDPNERGASRLWIMREVEASLKRLGTDYIDLYQVHRPDLDTDLDHTISALTDLVRQGKIRYFGTSTFPAWQMTEAQWISRSKNLEYFSTEQAPYSIFVRGVELDVLPVAQRYKLGVIAWSPLAGGWLTGKYRKGAVPGSETRAITSKKWEGVNPQIPQRYDFERPGNQRKLSLLGQLVEIANEAGISVTHMAMAFCLAHPSITSAIMGPRTLPQLEDLLSGVDVRLDEDALEAIDECVRPGTVVEDADRGWVPPWLSRDAFRISAIGVHM